MRRSRSEFAWVSMMDLLFGLFGSLVILAILITLKLGSDSGVERRPFQLVTIEALSGTNEPTAHRELTDALKRMGIGFRVTLPEQGGCTLGASFESEACQRSLSMARDDVPVIFRSAVIEEVDETAPLLSSTLFVGDGGPLRISPIIYNTAALQDQAALRDGATQVVLRINVKSSDTFWAPAPFCMSVADLIAEANEDPQGVAPLDFCALPQCGNNQTYMECDPHIGSGGNIELQ